MEEKKEYPVEQSAKPSLDVNPALESNDYVAIDERKFVRKIDWRIMPLLWMGYNLQYLDKVLINFAQQMGMLEDANMTQNQYSNLALAFYCTYLGFEIPTGYLMQKLPVAKYLAVNLVIWGLIVTVNCAAHNYAGFMSLRVLLGCFEASISPALIMITGMWYKKEEQPNRTGVWYIGFGTAQIIGALAAYGLLFYTGTRFKAWQILFLIFGLITIVTGVVVYFVVPNNPMTCKWLSAEERTYAVERLRENNSSIENREFKWDQFVEVFKDPQTWCLVVLMISALVPNGATSSFQGIIINSIGMDQKQTQLLTIPGGVVTIIAIAASSYIGGKYNARIIASCVLLIIGILGACLLAFLDSNHQAGQLVGNYLVFVTAANQPLAYSLVTANYAGYTKRSTMSALILMAFCLGNILGPLTFREKDAPRYVPAKIAIVATLAVSLVATALLYPYYKWENARRDKRRDQGEVQEAEAWTDMTDRQNKSFRYCL